MADDQNTPEVAPEAEAPQAEAPRQAPRSGRRMPAQTGEDSQGRTRGPRIGSKGEYLPAEYPTARGSIRRDN